MVNQRTVQVTKVLLLALSVICVYWRAFVGLWQSWMASGSYYSHGFLVPLVSGYFVWSRRKRLRETTPSSSKTGLLLLVCALLFALAGTYFQVETVTNFSLPVTLFGLIFYLFGWNIGRELVFPIAFLFFMIPLPHSVITALTFRLKLLVTDASILTLNAIGTTSVREGATVHMTKSFLVVGDVCSGLRSSIALLTLGIVYTHFIKSSLIKKLVLLAFCVPIALAANMLRVVVLCLVAESYGSQAATGGLFHDLTGMLVFVFALTGLIIAGKVLEKTQITRVLRMERGHRKGSCSEFEESVKL